MKIFLLFSLASFLASAVLSLLSFRKRSFCNFFSITGALSALMSGSAVAVHVLVTGKAVEIYYDWNYFPGSFHLFMDPLSAWFSISLLIIAFLCAIYGTWYLYDEREKSGYGFHWFSFHLLAGGIYSVFLAHDSFLFLFSWEIMSLSAWFLVMFDHEEKRVREAGWVYLAATHLGTAFLFILFASADIFTAAPGPVLSTAAVFLFALIGFGTKGGFFPFHVWLPEAHPAAPSHVSAIMSGVMIKTGIYGIFRVLTLLDAWQDWWGWLLIAAGGMSALYGIIFALSQHEIKKLLAYSSVENMGIILLGAGSGIIFANHNHPASAVAFAGSLLHVFNHSLFKTNLFLGAGTVIKRCGTGIIDLLGGLGKKMGITSALFLVSSYAICGFPFLNGFVGESLLYTASFSGLSDDTALNFATGFSGFTVIGILALTGGLAVVCFVKLYGTVFLGEGRSICVLKGRDPGGAAIIPMAVLSLISLLAGILPSVLLKAVITPVSVIHPAGNSSAAAEIPELIFIIFRNITFTAALFISIILVFFLLRTFLPGRKMTGYAPTWGCGFNNPGPKMQYTSSSFIQPLAESFAPVPGIKKRGAIQKGYFPEPVRFSTELPDPLMKSLFEPVFVFSAALFSKLKGIQQGSLHLYIFYIIATLSAVIIWSIL